jgi:hypothetical protein
MLRVMRMIMVSIMRFGKLWTTLSFAKLCYWQHGGNYDDG